MFALAYDAVGLAVLEIPSVQFLPYFLPDPTFGYIRKKDQACTGGLFNISDHGSTNLATCAHLCTASGSCGAFVHVPGDSDNSCRLKRSCPTPANLTGADLYFKRPHPWPYSDDEVCNATAGNRTEEVFT
ncbi:uncharacterized protein LOC144916464 [Branchiostoma floridae x Branchiostoma belcheri]